MGWVECLAIRRYFSATIGQMPCTCGACAAGSENLDQYLGGLPQFLDAASGAPTTPSTPAPSAASAAVGVPVFNSRPGASVNLILDFDGDIARLWKSTSVPATPAFNLDGNAAFSAAEVTAMLQILSAVAEKYSMFNVNVTTVDPGTLVGGRDAKIVIGGSSGWTGGSMGGIAYTGGFTRYNTIPNWGYVFPAQLALSPGRIAEATAHEAGHLFGLDHQSKYNASGTLTQAYNTGTALKAPIMGNSYSAQRGIWWNGTTTSATTIQDDLAKLSLVLTPAVDDHGGTVNAASPLSGASPFATFGIIGSTSDVDYFSITSSGGTLSASLAVSSFGAMLDGSIELRDASGQLIVSQATASLGETLSVNVSAGTYYLVVRSAGSYGDVGQFTLSGEIVPIAPLSIALPTNISVGEGSTTSITVTLASGQAVSYAWDLDSDGIYGEIGSAATRGVEVGASVVFNAAGLDGPSTHPIAVRVTGVQGEIIETAAHIAIQNVAPALSFSIPASINEGTTFSALFSGVDQGADTIASWTIEWGDGSTSSFQGSASSVQKVYADDGTFTVTLTAVDEDGTYSISRSITVLAVAPALTFFIPASANEGSGISVGFSATDPGSDTITSWIIHWGDGTSTTYLGSAAGGTKTFADNGTYTVTLTATDEDGSYVISRSITVLNVAPTLTFQAPTTVSQGSSLAVHFAATDPGSDSVTEWLVNWGDGNTTAFAAEDDQGTHAYLHNGTYTITLTAIEEDGSYSVSRILTVVDVAPNLTLSVPASVNEGSNLAVSFAATDAGSDVVSSWMINWGDGTTSSYAGSILSGSKAFADDGTYTITLTAFDQNGSYSVTRNIVVHNVLPSLSLAIPASGTEGSSFAVNFSATDPGADSIANWVIDWGDGSTSTLLGSATGASKTYADSGIYTVVLTATDEDGTYTVTRFISVHNVAPTLTLSMPLVANEGTQFGVNFAASDVGTDTVTRWTIDWGDGTSNEYSPSSTSVLKTYRDNGIYTITLSATDEDGTFHITRQITILNVAPTLSVSAPSFVNEGSSFQFDFSSTDPGSDAVASWLVDWGDGTTSPFSGSAVGGSKTYADDGTYTITLTAIDEDGNYSISRTVTVLNVAPTLLITVPSSANEGSSFAIGFSGTDAGSDTISSYLIDWGDGITRSLSGSATSASKTYADNGVYTITLTAVDEDGSYVTTRTMTVFNVMPTLSFFLPNAVAQGTNVRADFSATDPGLDVVSQWIINWGDGTTSTYAGSIINGFKVFANSGQYTVTLSAIDEDGTHSVSRSIAVTYVEPQVTFSMSPATQSVELGEMVSVSFDVTGGAEAVSVWIIDWGDGTTKSLVAGERSSSHVYDQPGSFTISLTAVTQQGVSVLQNVHATVQQQPQLIFGISASQDWLNVGQSVSMSIIDSNVPSDASWKVEWGDGTHTVYSTLPATLDHVFAMVGTFRPTVIAQGSFGVIHVAAPAISVLSLPQVVVKTLTPLTAATRSFFVDVEFRSAAGFAPGAFSASNLSVAGLQGAIVSLASVTSIEDGIRVARYRVAGANDWSFRDDGTYSLTLQGGAVSDAYGRSFPSAYGEIRMAIRPADGAGSTLDQARQLGEMAPGRAKNLSDAIGFFDKNDFYRVRLTKRSVLNVKLTGLADRADLRIYNGANVLVGESRRGGTSNEYVSLELNSGWYYVRVYDRNGVGSTYSLRVAADPLPVVNSAPPALPPSDTAGNDFTNARQLGLLTGSLQVSEYLSSSDKSDYYAMRLSSASAMALALTNLDANADLYLYDSAFRLVAQSARAGRSNENLSLNLSQGTYFVQVRLRVQTPTAYALTVRKL